MCIPEQAVPAAILEEVARWKRVGCPTCGQSAMFYCPFCCTPLGVPDGVAVPTARLPFRRCEVIFDDAAKKATSIHAKVLVPAQVRIVDLFTNESSANRTPSRRGPPALSSDCPGAAECESLDTSVVREIPEYDPRTTVVLFPDEGSVTYGEALSQGVVAPPADATLVIIDAPWRRAQTLRKHPRLAHLRSVRLHQPPPSHFWRYHAEGAGCVSTIEALAAFARELRPCDSAEGACLEDPLLFFFVRQFAHIVAAGPKAGGRVPGLPMAAEAKERRTARVRQKDRVKRLRPLGTGDIDGGASPEQPEERVQRPEEE